MSTLNDDRAADHDQAAHHDQAAVHDPAAHQFRIEMDGHPREADQRHLDELLDEALDESYPASDSPSVGGSS
jgi:hypothetical protein